MKGLSGWEGRRGTGPSSSCSRGLGGGADGLLQPRPGAPGPSDPRAALGVGASPLPPRWQHPRPMALLHVPWAPSLAGSKHGCFLCDSLELRRSWGWGVGSWVCLRFPEPVTANAAGGAGGVGDRVPCTPRTPASGTCPHTVLVPSRARSSDSSGSPGPWEGRRLRTALGPPGAL